jgi:hypothetical protein
MLRSSGTLLPLVCRHQQSNPRAMRRNAARAMKLAQIRDHRATSRCSNLTDRFILVPRIVMLHRRKTCPEI